MILITRAPHPPPFLVAHYFSHFQHACERTVDNSAANHYLKFPHYLHKVNISRTIRSCVFEELDLEIQQLVSAKCALGQDFTNNDMKEISMGVPSSPPFG